MNVGDIAEDALVRRLAGKLKLPARVAVGPGDDCAAIRVKGRPEWQLFKTDCLIENVHFLREQRADRVGWKALCRSLSDIGACGGRPDSAVVTVALPRDLDVDWIEQFYRGMERAARKYETAIVGGETARSPGGIFISVAMTGWVKPGRMPARGGGRAGDAIFVTGRLGGSIQGRHLTFEPRVREGRWLAKKFSIHAMMDLSDGLGSDLPRLADASRKGFEIDPAAIPRSRGCTVEQAVSDGEDYELLFTASSADADAIAATWAKKFPQTPLTCIGTLLAKRSTRTALPAGYVHFSGCQPGPNADS